MTARYDLEFFSGADETVVFRLATVDDGEAFDPTGSTFAVTLIAAGEAMPAEALSPVVGDDATDLTWSISSETTASLADQQALAKRIAYRLDRTTDAGLVRAYAHGNVQVGSPGSGGRQTTREATVTDRVTVIPLSIST